jgi:hypothetical protein
VQCSSVSPSGCIGGETVWTYETPPPSGPAAV